MRRILPAAALLLAACERPPIAWQPAALAMDAAGAHASPALPSLPSLPTAADGARCDALLRVVRLVPSSATDTSVADHVGHATPASPAGVAPAVDDDDWVAVWWSVRADSSAHLVSARSTDGGRSWAPAIPVDTLDRSTRGCARPAPAVAYEPRRRYVHVAYFLDAPEGPGVFYAHSMDAGLLYDPVPIPIVYGERVSRAAVSARGDTVAVAFEDPNTRAPQVALAVSVTGGHIFVEKNLPVSGGTFAATEPSVALGDAGIEVRWAERQQDRVVTMRRSGRWR